MPSLKTSVLLGYIEIEKNFLESTEYREKIQEINKPIYHLYVRM